MTIQMVAAALIAGAIVLSPASFESRFGAYCFSGQNEDIVTRLREGVR